jgi:hypothetical protein
MTDQHAAHDPEEELAELFRRIIRREAPDVVPNFVATNLGEVLAHELRGIADTVADEIHANAARTAPTFRHRGPCCGLRGPHTSYRRHGRYR